MGLREARILDVQLRFFTVDFGMSANDPEKTLKVIAECSQGLYFKGYSVNDLLNIYQIISDEILFSSQRVKETNIIATLNNSYIEYAYIPVLETAPELGEIPIAIESASFVPSMYRMTNNTYLTAETGLEVLPSTRIASARALSYSSTNWTTQVWVKGNNSDIPKNVFNISDLLHNVSSMILLAGDPFALLLPVGNETETFFVAGTNTVYLSAGVSASSMHPGSKDSKVLSNLLISTLTGSGSFAPRAQGCYWDIIFSNQRALVIPVPINPPPALNDVCDYKKILFCHDPDSLSLAAIAEQATLCTGPAAPLPTIVTQDAINSAFYRMLKTLDLDRDGKRDGVIQIPFTADGVQVEVTSNNIPYLIGPSEMEIRVWN